jgi:hypothetical protein
MKMKKNQQITEYADCIVDYLKSEFWAEIQMRYTVYDASQLPVAERRRKLSEMERLSESKSEIGINYCLNEAQFGALFDELSKSNNESEHDYCGRKYLMDNQIRSEYEIKLTENFNSSNCEEKIEEFESEIEHTLIKDIRDINPNIEYSDLACILRKYREQNYPKKMLEFSVISKLDLSLAQFRNEKKNFVKYLSLITYEVKQCV